jgi:hypothetical protein
LERLWASGLAAVPLLPMPTSPEDTASLAPLRASVVLPNYPREWASREG